MCHDPTTGTFVVMRRDLKMLDMAQAVTDLVGEDGLPLEGLTRKAPQGGIPTAKTTMFAANQRLT